MRLPIINPLLIIPSLLLLILGVTMLSTFSPGLINVQIFAIISATLVFLILTQIQTESWQHLASFFYISSFLLLLLTIVIGQVNRGTNSWIDIGPLSIQPAEITRTFIILMFAKYASMSEHFQFKNLVMQVLLFILPATILFLQPDLGSIILLGSGWLSIIVAQKFPLKVWVICVVIVGLLIPIGWSQLKVYQKQRLYTFINPASDPLGSGYNVIQSQIAIGAGQVNGRGFGRGTQSQLRFLPEFHTDFIFAAISEELGLIGGVIIIFFYFLIFMAFLQALDRAQDPFHYYSILGLFATLFTQVMINIGMNQGIMPVTGITLPLVSYGGSSLIATAIMLAYINNVSILSKTPKVIQIR